jgi:hypothetical protein
MRLMREGNRLSSVITAALGGRTRHRALDEPTLQCLLKVILMADALRGISCHQRPSEAIRGHQRTYAPISARQRRTKSSMPSKLMKEATMGHQQSSQSSRRTNSSMSSKLIKEAIMGHQQSSQSSRRTNSSMSSKLPSSWVHGWSALSCPVTYAQNSA